MNAQITSIKTFFILFAFLTFSADHAIAKDALEKGSTLKFSYVMPNSDFGLFTINSASNPFDSYTLKSANPGFGLAYGTMFFINAIDLGEKMKIGVDVTWMSFTYQSTTHNYNIVRLDRGLNTNKFFTGEFNMYQLQFLAEVGPSFSYSPVEKLGLDVSLKISPTFNISGGNYKVDYDGGNTETIGGVGFGLRYTPAFYVRYSVLLLGVEYNIGDLNMKYESQSAFPESISSTVPYTALRIVFGFKF